MAAPLRAAARAAGIGLHRAHVSASCGSNLVCRCSWIRRAHTIRKAAPFNMLSMSASSSPRYCSSQNDEAEMPLLKQKCTPCSSRELRPMDEEVARTLLEQIPAWELLELNGRLQLHRSWKAKNFMKGLEFMKSIADVAEAEGHHPDLHLVGWNNLTVDIFTHSIGGLTRNDFILAAKISTLNTEGFLRKVASTVAPKPI